MFLTLPCALLTLLQAAVGNQQKGSLEVQLIFGSDLFQSREGKLVGFKNQKPYFHYVSVCMTTPEGTQILLREQVMDLCSSVP